MRNETIIKNALNTREKEYFLLYLKNGSFRERVFNALYQLKQISRIKGNYQTEKAIESFLSYQR